MNEELFGEIHEQEEYGLFGKEHERQQCFLHNVVGQSELLPCKHVEKLMQGDGFVYVICALCGEDL